MGDTWEQRGLTRRRFLVGAGLAAGAGLIGGGLAARRLPLDDWYGDVVGGGEPDARGVAPSTIMVQWADLQSQTVDGPVPYAISWPPGTTPGDPLPVCFALPPRGGGPPVWFGEPLAEAVECGKVEPFAIAGVHGGESYWHPRASGEDRLSMLLDEFVPLCAERYRLGERRRAVVGWSMGGYGALLAAETRPELFAAVVAVSPAVWTTYEEMKQGPGDAFDDAADFARHDVIAHADRLAGVRVRIDCGTDDGFWGYVTHLTTVLPEPAAGGFSAGGHGGGYWREVAPAEVEFVGQALGR